ncbi:poly(R)-hydroxyalkanoic acid synthase subunit PhaE [Halogeometricum luteum]|uniref:Poly(3-hydroxyalkanoate) polymerase subunit PhaE n=1 Tax=Halogeometricum luteum TaxID=2950537 RepID=A0ABU2G4M8_9EURY|nr:poly(R)-hydroxyalkanoic acid synthase subunit PhaE [Halogeometricum sp. S3BR5-2]MDS0295249.1 poly(R)-hydroxyalkanoic acid synthase subunit [Halogeometricum sp. S3BR5-2]
MSESNQWSTFAGPWSEFLEESNEAFTASFRRTAEAQTAFARSWFDAVEGSTGSSAEAVEESIEAYTRMYVTWATAMEDALERVSDSLEGEDVDPEDFRDIWLNAANESFKQVTSTSAFAGMTGRNVEETMRLQREFADSVAMTLQTFGFATRDDVREVGERLVELERRQHAIESKLDRLIDDRDA